MNTIWKYELKVTDLQKIKMPITSKILTIQMQLGVPCLWAEVNTEEVLEEHRTIEMFGTGHEIPDHNRTYIGTIQQANGKLIWHIYERI